MLGQKTQIWYKTKHAYHMLNVILEPTKKQVIQLLLYNYLYLQG